MEDFWRVAVIHVPDYCEATLRFGSWGYVGELKNEVFKRAKSGRGVRRAGVVNRKLHGGCFVLILKWITHELEELVSNK